MEPIVSIIIPVYNTELYLSTCIESILTQSFSDFECILVDDGSTDGSGVICDIYAEKDQRIHVLHKKNNGVCSARNLGLDNANGEFIVFMDSDDFIKEHHLEHLMRSDSDLVITGVQKFQAKNEVSVPRAHVDFKIEDLPSYWNTPPNMNYLYCFPWAKRFRASIIRDHCIRFNESLFFTEDMCFNMQFMSFANSVSELPYDDYMYRMEFISRDEKYKMSASQLISHYEYLDSCFKQLYSRLRPKSLSFVRDNTNFRLVKKYYYYLLNCPNAKGFVSNIRLFRNQSWAHYLLELLTGKKAKRIMKEAVRAPFLTYIVEIRLKAFLRR